MPSILITPVIEYSLILSLSLNFISRPTKQLSRRVRGNQTDSGERLQTRRPWLKDTAQEVAFVLIWRGSNKLDEVSQTKRVSNILIGRKRGSQSRLIPKAICEVILIGHGQTPSNAHNQIVHPHVTRGSKGDWMNFVYISDMVQR